MRYMNDYDLDNAVRRFDNGSVPNRLAVAVMVARLADWANSHSDGWAYWPKPCRSAARAIALIDSTAYPEYDRREREDITVSERTKAAAPIKAFMTREARLFTAEEREFILRPVS